MTALLVWDLLLPINSLSIRCQFLVNMRLSSLLAVAAFAIEATVGSSECGCTKPLVRKEWLVVPSLFFYFLPAFKLALNGIVQRR